MVSEKFRRILETEQVAQLIPFLKQLDAESKKTITTEFKQLANEYLAYKHTTSLLGQTTVAQKATPRQHDILYATAFACFSRKEYEKFDPSGQLFNNPLLDNILPWYCPDWFSDLTNNLERRDWLPWQLTYNKIMRWANQGYLKPSDELIVRLIPDVIFDVGVNHQRLYAPQNLEAMPITLDKHIWFIFQFETNIHASDRYHQFQNSTQGEKHWLLALKNCVNQGKLDRQRLLRESLLATSRNFNKALSGWFVELFDFLEPTQQEILALQPELLNCLGSQHSKAVNSALSSFKQIVELKGFYAREFLEHLPILLAAETKSVVSSTLVLLEKIIRKNPLHTEEICISVCQAFIHPDESIQSKVCKILLKFHDGSSVLITDEMSKYTDSMLMSSRKSLAELFASHTGTPEETVPAPHESAWTPQPVQRVTSIDDLVFLASQAFDNNDPLHIDLLPAALVNLQDQLTGEVLHKFEAALQRAYAKVTGEWVSDMGYLDHLMAVFFIDITHLLINRYPAEGIALRAIHDSMRKRETERASQWSWYKSGISSLNTWSPDNRDNTYIIHKGILLTAYEKIRQKDHTPLLSTPTHEKGYLDPVELVRRLDAYDNNQVVPEDLDFQLALSRVAPFHRDAALQDAKQKLNGEILRILEFLFSENTRPAGPYTTPSLWFMAGVTKNPNQTFPEFNKLSHASMPTSSFTGNVPWKSFVEHYKINQYNFKTKKTELVPSQRNVLRLTLNATPTIWRDTQEKSKVLSTLAGWISPVKKLIQKNDYTLYEYLTLKATFLSFEQNDIQRFIYLFPSNPNPLLTLVTASALEYGTFYSETAKKIVIKTLEALIHLKFHVTEMTYLFIATCMITSDKTVRSFAAELWITGTPSKHLQSSVVGRIIGIHVAAGYAPLKRFTDLISSSLMQISKHHNQELQVLLESTLTELPDEPPIGTKKLLELYSEILAINNASVKEPQVKDRLTKWSSSAGLKKTIATLPT